MTARRAVLLVLLGALIVAALIAGITSGIDLRLSTGPIPTVHLETRATVTP